jgi:hypothetical protein
MHWGSVRQVRGILRGHAELGLRHRAAIARVVVCLVFNAGLEEQDRCVRDLKSSSCFIGSRCSFDILSQPRHKQASLTKVKVEW